MTGHVLLVASDAGYETEMYREAAHRLGLAVTIAGEHARQEHERDDRFVAVRLDEPEEAVDAIRRAGAEDRFTAITSVGERTTFLTALAAQALGLAFHPPYAVDAANNKHYSRLYYLAAGLPQPEGRLWLAAGDAHPAAAETRFPCVLKPVGLSKGQGIIRANNSEEFLRAFARIAAILETADTSSPADPRRAFLRVEEYISGEEFAVEGFVTKGRFERLALFDMPDSRIGPYFEETLCVTPSRHSAEVQAEIQEAMNKGVAALGLLHGQVHGTVRHNHEGTWILGIRPQPLGTYCGRAMRFANGLALAEVVLRHACGESLPALEPAAKAMGMMRMRVPRSGTYRGVVGVAAARAVAGITSVNVTAFEGQRVRPYPEGAGHLGYLLACGEGPLSVEQSLREAHGLLEFDIASAV